MQAPTLNERMAMAFVDAERIRKDHKPGWLEAAEEELERRRLEIRRDLSAELLGAHDVDAPVIEIDGTLHRRVLRAAQMYMTAAGPVTAERWLYQARRALSAARTPPRRGAAPVPRSGAAVIPAWLIGHLTERAYATG